MTHVPAGVSMLERALREIFGGRLHAFVTYGVHASTSIRQTTGSREPSASARSLAIVESLTEEDLKQCADRAAGWHNAGLATPLLLAAHELDRSLDAFPLEFGAIIADHTVVAGRNPFEGLSVDPVDVRRACEVQARSHLLHLREGFIETRGRADALAALIVRSAAPFAALLTSVARLEGLTGNDAAAAGRHVERTLRLAPGVMTDVVALVGVNQLAAAEAVRIFPTYLDAAGRLVADVDGWNARR